MAPAAGLPVKSSLLSLDTKISPTYNPTMKAFLVLLTAAAVIVILVGCESDVAPDPANEAGEKLQRGVTGQGTLYQPDRSGDPLIREQSRVGY
jgi:hypothetical protein